MAIAQPVDVIVSDPDVRNGQPIIAGTRIRLSDVIASHIFRGLSPDDVAVNYRLTLAQVYAALAYYYQNKPEMDAQMQAEAESAQTLLADFEAQGKLIRLG
jgi:uncharacterized protein (DUF433 family)